jgi:hypothetical protein
MGVELAASGIRNEKIPVIARSVRSYLSQVPYVSDFGIKIKELFYKTPSSNSFKLPCNP